MSRSRDPLTLTMVNQGSEFSAGMMPFFDKDTATNVRLTSRAFKRSTSEYLYKRFIALANFEGFKNLKEEAGYDEDAGEVKYSTVPSPPVQSITATLLPNKENIDDVINRLAQALRCHLEIYLYMLDKMTSVGTMGAMKCFAPGISPLLNPTASNLIQSPLVRLKFSVHVNGLLNLLSSRMTAVIIALIQNPKPEWGIQQISRLIKSGANLESSGFDHSLLVHAVKVKNDDIAELLIRSGANIKLSSDYPEDVDVLEVLLKEGLIKGAKAILEKTRPSQPVMQLLIERSRTYLTDPIQKMLVKYYDETFKHEPSTSSPGLSVGMRQTPF